MRKKRRINRPRHKNSIQMHRTSDPEWKPMICMVCGKLIVTRELAHSFYTEKLEYTMAIHKTCRNEVLESSA